MAHLPRISRKVLYITGALVALFGIIIIAILVWRCPSQQNIPKQLHATNAGISINGLSGDSIQQLNRKFADIAKLGFTWVRLDIAWFNVQPSNPRQYTWLMYDNEVNTARRYHLKVLGILAYAPSWAAQSNCSDHSSCAPKNSTQFATFAAQTAQHYKQSVSDWEIWNEENISQSWSPIPNAEQYSQLLKQSYTAIKTVNPSATVILGGMAAGDNGTKQQIDGTSFLKQVYDSGAKGSFDAIAYHPYTYPAAPSTYNAAWSKLFSLHTVMQSYGDSAKQIWITEYGAPTEGPSSVSESRQAHLAQDAIAAVQGKTWIGPFFWYNYQDTKPRASSKGSFFGVRSSDGTPKPAYYTWQELLK
jgi:hypothetical protein